MVDDSHHGGEGFFDAAFAFGIDRAALTNGVGHIGGALFIEPEQADFVGEFREEQIDEATMIGRHHENVGGFLEEFLGHGLATEFR